MIGMYAHHSGSGHLHRVRAIQKHLGQDSVVFSSDPGADITLPMDTEPSHGSVRDETANDTVHWAPIGVPGHTERLAIIAEWIAKHQPSVFYVDCSVDIAIFVRLMGIPVVTIAMPGFRHDRPHQVSYLQADALIAAWPDWVPVPACLIGYEHKIHPVGGISRFDGEAGEAGEATVDPTEPTGPTGDADHVGETDDNVVILRGAGGDDFDKYQWPQATILGGDVRVENPMPYLRSASVVIAAAGQNSVADLALARVPAVIFPQERPFGEQDATSQHLDRAQLAVILRDHPTPEQWPLLFEEARRRAANWHLWQVEGAAARAAQVIESVATRYRR